MRANNKRFEFVLPMTLFERVRNRALAEGMSFAEIVRKLLERWDRGEISSTVSSNYVKYKGDNDREMFMYADAELTYKFGVVAAKIGMNRIQLLQKLMQEAVDGDIDVS